LHQSQYTQQPATTRYQHTVPDLINNFSDYAMYEYMKLTLPLTERLDALRYKADAICLREEIFTTRRNQHDEESLGASSPLCYKQLGRGWGTSKHMSCILFIMLTTTCFGHCGPSSGHKNVYRGKLYRV